MRQMLRLRPWREHREQMEEKAQERRDLLAEMADLEGQLAQTQVDNVCTPYLAGVLACYAS